MEQLAKQTRACPVPSGEPQGVQELFGSVTGLEDAVNYNLENDAHKIIDQMIN